MSEPAAKRAKVDERAEFLAHWTSVANDILEDVATMKLPQAVSDYVKRVSLRCVRESGLC